MAGSGANMGFYQHSDPYAKNITYDNQDKDGFSHRLLMFKNNGGCWTTKVYTFMTAHN